MPRSPHEQPFHSALEDIDPLSASVFHSFKRVMHLHRRFMLKMLAEMGSHPAQAGCLRALARHEGSSQRELAEHLGVSRPTVTTMLHKMERSGLVSREPDPADRRVTRVRLTPAGRRTLQEQSAVFAELIGTSIGRLPERDRAELERILERLGEVLERALEGDPGSRLHSDERDDGAEGRR